MNKQFTYRGFTFNIKVDLITRQEKRINGNIFHTVTVNCVDFDNYYLKKEVCDTDLISYTYKAENVAKQHIDKKLDKPSPDQRLSAIGFYLISGIRQV